MAAIEGEREIFPEPQDLRLSPWKISEDQIAKFCGGCDFLLSVKNHCQLIRPNDQGRYATREICGWARVDGISGTMTAKGFLSGVSPLDPIIATVAK